MWERLRRYLVRDRDDRLRRRRPGDVVRVVVGVLLLALLAVHAGDYFQWERDVTQAVHDLPDGAIDLARTLYNLLALWALGIVVVGIALARRWRLARDVAAGGAVAWLLGRLVAFFTHRTDLAHAFSVVFDTSAAPRFPLVRVGMAVAVISVAGPYLARVTRWIGRALVALLCAVALYLGHAFVTDVAGAVLLGWAVANAVRYAFGTPVGRPTVGQVRRALSRRGIPVTDLRVAPDQHVGRAVFLAKRDDGQREPLRVVALGRDEADAQFLARAWRFIAYRDFPANLMPTRKRQVEYEAYVTLLAADAGANVPHTVLAANAGAVALLVQTEAVGTPLAEADVEQVTDGVLDDAWCQAARVHAVGIAHGVLDAEHLVVREAAVTVVGWSHAVTGADVHAVAHDHAQLLSATAAVVGVERAVAAASRALEVDDLLRTLPLLQPAALSGATRDSLDRAGGVDETLERLREETAAAAGSDVPELRRIYRVQARQIVMAVSALFAIGFLFSRIGDPGEFWDTIRDASWGYVVLSFVLGLLTDVSYAVALLGTIPIRVPLWPMIELQSSLSFANLAVPVAADAALQVRFLQKNGLSISEAVATGGVLSTVTEIVIQVGLFLVALWLAPDSIDFGHIDTGKVVVIALIAIFAVGIVAAVIFSVRRIRRAVIPPVLQALRAMWVTIKSPFRLALMVGGNVAANCLYAASLLACLHAFGASLNFWTLLATNIGISLIAGLVPLPGGGTAVSAIGISGIMVALGVPTAAATAAVLAHQLAVNYVPALPGWFASNDLARKGLL